MTEDEKAKLIEEAVKAHKDAIKARKADEIKAGFLNPFGIETTYVEFLEEVKKSKMSVAEYCKDKITKDQLEWLEKELSIIKEK